MRTPEKTLTKMNFAMNQSYLYEYTLSEIFLAVEEEVGEKVCAKERLKVLFCVCTGVYIKVVTFKSQKCNYHS